MAEANVAAEAVVDPSAQIEEGCIIHPFAYVGPRVKLGARAEIGPGAVILEGCEIGPDTVIAGEAVVGSCGFGYVFDGQQHLRLPQIGGVRIGPGAVVGPATCIDRATLDSTDIGARCRLGALTQVAHNCSVGDESQLGSGCGLAGSTRLGRRTRFGDLVGTNGHSVYGDDVTAENLTGFTRTQISTGTHWSGHPARQKSANP